ncbi:MULTISPECIES: (2Fe-2S)-binding protein [unclassified Mycobacterium]|uniref:(2Fe-2S)-binding protein n=1 Tax=unclassified Mycobacterium TaxID=2642494 RepID=UPI00073FF3E5|nr:MULTISPECIES: (2Fe-2S)-binding protein [unclassified Mycobacterium]KUH80020.1 iron reductase [Mycobacterium sp. GA-0227b]KUH80595.1 iron reductase [Mycobacterium sp. IS-1556]KUH82582.1 iron reductase [Mycobacterium sp. GA-1999]
MRISTELSEVARYGGFFAIAVGGDDRGWRPVEECYADGYADLIDATCRRYRTTDRRVSASLVQMSHASRLWSPVLACAVAHGVVPDLIGLQRANDSAALRISVPEGSRADAQLANALYRIVVEGHLERLADGLRVKVAPPLLYGNIASALVAATRALYSLRPQLRGDATRLARSLLETGRLAGSGTVKHNLAFRRRSCCLYYRIGDGSKCSDCALRRLS